MTAKWTSVESLFPRDILSIARVPVHSPDVYETVILFLSFDMRLSCVLKHEA